MFARRFIFGTDHRSSRIWVVLSVAMGLAILIVLSSIFNGFQNDLVSRFYQEKSHFFIFEDSHDIDQFLQKHPLVKMYEVRQSVPVMLTYANHSQFIVMSSSSNVPEDQISLPHNIAAELAVTDGDYLRVSALNTRSLIPYPMHKNFKTHVNLKSIAPIARIHSLKNFADTKNLKTGWWVWLNTNTAIGHFKSELIQNGYQFFDTGRHLDYLLTSLQIQKLSMFFIFVLVVSLLFTQMMSMLRQMTNYFAVHVAYLKASGVSHWRIGVFLCQVNGGFIALTLILGLIIGLTISYYATDLCHLLEYTFGINVMATNAFMLDYLPSKISFFEVGVICITYLIVTIVMLVPIIGKVLKQSPVNVFRGSIYA